VLWLRVVSALLSGVISTQVDPSRPGWEKLARWNRASLSFPAKETKRMMKLQEVILEAMAKKLIWIEAAEIAAMSVRNPLQTGRCSLFTARNSPKSILTGVRSHL
jgi:hypothetical protein